MNKFLSYFIDFIFPPNEEELKLRNISPVELFNISPRSHKTPSPFISSIFSYKDPLVKEMIWQIKYKKNAHTLKCAGFALYKELLKYEKVKLIPIPISNKRRKERGYNQCELLIEEVLKLDIDNRFSTDYKLLIRPKHIEKQTFKDRDQRIEDIKGIFEVTYPGNFKIVIIDDVTTTGSTLKEARGVLLRSGYEVEAVTVAH